MKMKQHIALSLAIGILSAGSIFAGGGDVKSVAPTPLCDFGTGWYVALDGGANVYQSFDTNFTRTFSNGDDISLTIDHNVGGYGGIKFGYVFGNGMLRPTIEEDMFYNGIPTDAHVKFNGTEVAHSSNLINSGAFMTNFILRFGTGRFQPYIGGGVGAYYAEAAGADVTVNRGGGRTFFTGGGANSGSFAFDAVAGADYYMSCKWSIFAEYHFLDYCALDVGDGNHQFGQQLVGAGIRFHF